MMLVTLLLVAGLSGPVEFTEPCVPGELVVQLAPECRGRVNAAIDGVVPDFGIPELDGLCRDLGVTKIFKIIRDPNPNKLAQSYGLDLLYTLRAGPEADVSALVAASRANACIAGAWPNIMRPLQEVPNDPSYTSQWHLLKIRAAEAWDVSHGSADVRIAVVDDGVDYFHPDVVRNLWINGPEDINGNGKFDPYSPPGGDLNNVDDDGNGYTDDVCGYDFVNYDPDPMPVHPDDHGTHCWGVTNAVTNNDTGVASIGWGCKGMGLKAGQGGYVMMGAAVAATYYSVEKGAWVSSHSYGSNSPYPPEQAAMEYAYSMGALVCAAAGNNGVQSRHYPGAYDVCIAVAASDISDHRASWSNYGDWIEVASPGCGIIATVPDSNYAAMDGTSMATPLVAGLLSLIKAGDPSLTNDAARERLFNTCDTMPDPDFRAGLLGHGRINAMKALAQGSRSYLTMTGQHVRDPNGNGIPEPGEVCGITVTLRNETGWQTATGVQATLSCSDPNITITKATATFPDIPGGGSANCAADSFLIQVAGNAVPHRVVFHIEKTSTPGNLAPGEDFSLQMGLPRILLVNDYAGDDIARWYRWSCDSLRALYDQYATASSGAPSADTLRHYPVVIWFTGLDSTNCVSTACQTALTSFMDNGGRLFICGQNIGQQISSSPFYANYLRAQLDTVNTGKLFTLGLHGDPIGNGETIVCGSAGGANNCRSPDGIKPINGALGSIIYKDFPDTTVYGAIRYSGSYQMVYFAEPFEAIDHQPSRYTQKWTILRRIMGLFGEPLPGAVAEPEFVTTAVRPGLAVVPNPARAQALVNYGLTATRSVAVRIYDTEGRLVRQLDAGQRPAGNHQVNWNLRDSRGGAVPRGVYFCSLIAGPDSRTGKILVND